jgi:hypothetical protein
MLEHGWAIAGQMLNELDAVLGASRVHRNG